MPLQCQWTCCLFVDGCYWQQEVMSVSLKSLWLLTPKLYVYLLPWLNVTNGPSCSWVTSSCLFFFKELKKALFQHVLCNCSRFGRMFWQRCYRQQEMRQYCDSAVWIWLRNLILYTLTWKMYTSITRTEITSWSQTKYIMSHHFHIAIAAWVNPVVRKTLVAVSLIFVYTYPSLYHVN